MILEAVGPIIGAIAGGAVMLAACAWNRHRSIDPAIHVQQRMLEALANGTDGIALYDAANRLVTCNERYRTLLAPISAQIKPGVDFDVLMRSLADAAQYGEEWYRTKTEKGGRAANGTSDEQLNDGHWVTISAYATADGGQLRILRDVTRRKQAQLSLEDTVGWLKGVMDTVVDGIITIDESGSILSFNTAAQHIFGYSPEEVVGSNINILMPEPYRSAHGGFLLSSINGEPHQNIGTSREVHGQHHNGRVFPLELVVSEMRQHGMVTFIGLVRDISARKKAEQALLDSERRSRAQAMRLQAIIDNMPQGVAVFGEDDALIALNDSATRMLGLPDAEITPGTIDISLFMALLAESQSDSADPLSITCDLAESIRERPEMVFEHSSHSGVIMEVRSSSMPDGGLILSFTDITDRKRTEQTLRDARDEAERGNRAKATFLANISHELRTPLNAIIGFSEMMKHEIFGPLEPVGYRTYIDDIHESGQHLLELINDILDMSKAEAGMTDLSESPVDVTDIIRISIRLLARRAQSAGITLVDTLPPDLPPLQADERRMRQIMLNLLSNAVKFSDDGGSVTVSVEIDQAGMRIIVSDTGIGMTQEELGRVMEPFVQADTRLSRKYEGSGLGLPLTKALVTAHGGTLTLESAPGLGTTATVSFPPGRVLSSDMAVSEA
ncbi:Signal transduction histidine kinase [Candidatus Terasakiella magnetica]|nr:Signal transduction histidine kinase [Candidatus Terasakiella magnetica]